MMSWSNEKANFVAESLNWSHSKEEALAKIAKKKRGRFRSKESSLNCDSNQVIATPRLTTTPEYIMLKQLPYSAA